MGDRGKDRVTSVSDQEYCLGRSFKQNLGPLNIKLGRNHYLIISSFENPNA